MHSQPTLSQQRHDELVLKHALDLLEEGYQVSARLEGIFELPDPIYGYRPDVVAHGFGRVVIVEIKKGDVDWPKLAALEKYASERQDEVDLRVVAA